MKKLLPLLCVLAVAVCGVPDMSGSVAVYPYETTNYKTDGWTCVNQKSGVGWTIYTAYCEAKVITGPADSYLFSPALTVEEGNNYKFTFDLTATNKSYWKSICNFFIFDSPAKDGAVLAELGQIELTQSEATTPRSVSFEWRATTSGSVYFTVQDITNGSDKGYFTKLSGFSVTEEAGEKAPAAVASLTAIPAPDQARSVTLTWTNPSTYNTGEALVISAIKIFRDKELLATLTDDDKLVAGAVIEHIDSFEESGVYTYEVTVVDQDGLESRPASVTTPYVGPFDGLTPPYTFDFTNNKINGFWSLTATEGSQQWAISTADQSLSVSLSHINAIDALALSPVFNLDAGKAYKMTFKGKASRKANIICLGAALYDTSGEMVREFMPVEEFMPAENNVSEEFSYKFSPSTTGQFNFGWKAEGARQAQSYYENTVTLTDISVIEIPAVPVPASQLTATADPEGELRVTLSWLNPELTETGLPAGEITAAILRDGEIIAENLPTSGETGSYEDNSVPTSGYHTYSVRISNAAGCSETEAPEVLSPFVGKAKEIPFTADFVSEANLFIGVETGEKANGNTFTVTDGKGVLNEKPSDFADALLTPPLHLLPGHLYNASVEASLQSGYSSYNCRLVLLKGSDMTDFSNILADGKVTNRSTVTTADITVEEEGSYYIAFEMTAETGSSATQVNVTAMEITELPVLPARPEKLKALAASDGTRSVEISWIMPTVSPEGVPLTETLTAALYRGSEVAEEATPLLTVDSDPGMECSFTDNEASEGINSYCIVLANPGTDEIPGGQSEPFTFDSDYCAKATILPYTGDFATEEGRAMFTFLDEGSNKGTGFSFTEDNQIYILDGTSATSSSTHLDDWIVTPLFIFEEGVNYTVEFEARCASGSSSYYYPGYEVFVGADKTAVSLKAGTMISEPSKKLTPEFATYTCAYTLPKEEVIMALAEDDDSGQETQEPASVKRFIGMHFGGGYSYPEVAVKSIKVKSDKITSDVDIAEAAGEPIPFIAGQTVIAGRDTGIKVFDTAGRLKAASTGSLDLSPLASGVYVIRAGNTSIKFVKR